MTVSCSKPSVKLSNNLIIGKGRDRLCYLHPGAEEQCIKISVTSDKQSRREIKYFNFLQRKKTDLSLISSYRGSICTDQGKGEIFDLVRDNVGKASVTLKQALLDGVTTYALVKGKLDNLKSYLKHNNIAVRDISPSNIMYKKQSQGQFDLIIVDGIGNPGHNPLSIRLPVLIEKNINKCWISLEKKIAVIVNSLERSAASAANDADSFTASAA